MTIRLGGPHDSHLITHRLEDVSVGILATPDYLARRGTSRNLTDLTIHDCLKFILTHQRPPDALDLPRYPQTGLGDDRTQPLPRPRRCAGLHQLGLRLRRAIPDRPFHRRATRRPRRSGRGAAGLRRRQPPILHPLPAEPAPVRAGVCFRRFPAHRITHNSPPLQGVSGRQKPAGFPCATGRLAGELIIF